MYAAVYALSRLILFGFGWAVAALVALLAEMMMAGTMWPLFAISAGWWTFACAVYVEGEGGVAPQADRQM
jgi:hypothetical protein